MNSPPNHEAQSLRLAIVGWGSIAQTVAKMLEGDRVKIVAIAKRDWASSTPDGPETAATITKPSELAQHRPDLVIEAAGRDSVGPWGHAALEAGADFVVSSVSALAQPDLFESLRCAAERTGRQLIVQPGALGGIDALASAQAIGIDAVEHRIVKPPAAWRGSPAEHLCSLDHLDSPTIFFASTAAEAATQFPQNANVAMTTALAGVGPDATQIILVADPAATKNRHEIKAHGAFGELHVTISNNPLPDNPKTSAMAALNLARIVTNRVSTVVI